MIYIGIDPGLSGGIAWITDSGIVCAIKMPETERDVLDLFEGIGGAGGAGMSIAFLERVGVMPAQGIVSAFTFGKGIGGLRMALTAARIRFDEVTPATWQRAMQCLSGGDKNITKRRAQQLFPDRTITHATADALLIAEYGRRLHAGVIRKDRSHGKKENRRAQGTKEARRPAPGRTERQAAFESRAQARAARRGAPGNGGPRNPGTR